MSFRSRLLLAFLALALAPLIFFGLRVRAEVTERLGAQHEHRVAALADVIEQDLQRESVAVAARLARLAEAMAADSRLRLAVRSPEGRDRAYLLDYASRAMPLAGLDFLRVQDEEGRVLSSGHFRNEYDAVDPALPAAVGRAGDRAVLVALPTPSGPRLGLARARTLELGTRRLALIGATAVDDGLMERLARGTGLEVRLEAPVSTAAAADPARYVVVRLAGAGADSLARFVIRPADDPLPALREEMDRWLGGTLAAAAALALVLALLVSGGLGRPLAALARRAERLDLDRLNVSFPTDRSDEIGALARVLDRMTGRLRTSAAELREAERRATIGEVARQVNHDLRNGLIPIRNVVQHLTELAGREPDRLPAVFRDRQRTLESSLQYLDGLATRYGRLSPRLEPRACDLNEIVREVAEDAEREVPVEADLEPDLPPVMADPVALRRILENLLVNAVDSYGKDGERAGPPDGHPEGAGSVVVWTRRREADAPAVAFGVTDRGRGMTPEERGRIFQDFYTTKPEGSGLGLSIVRRLVGDLGGRIRVESEPGAGTRVTVELPAEDAPGGPR